MKLSFQLSARFIPIMKDRNLLHALNRKLLSTNKKSISRKLSLNEFLNDDSDDLKSLLLKKVVEGLSNKKEAEILFDYWKEKILKIRSPTVMKQKNEHEVYGKLLVDLGYKKVYLTNIEKLIRIPVWEKQRILRPERAKEIANLKSKNGTKEKLPGIITLFEDIQTGRIGILDGQHRAGALLILAQRNEWNEKAYNIMIEIFPIENKNDISNLFKEINSSEPVLDVDVPTEDPKSINHINILNIAVEALSNRYPAMFKPSMKCRPPHLNIDVLRDDLYQSDIITRLNIRTPEALLEKLEAINTKFATNDKITLKKESGLHTRSIGEIDTNFRIIHHIQQLKTYPETLRKARENKFYLGLGDKGWMHSI
jgi:hypothetical protein